jgi:hypothetical protein
MTITSVGILFVVSKIEAIQGRRYSFEFQLTIIMDKSINFYGSPDALGLPVLKGSSPSTIL